MDKTKIDKIITHLDSMAVDSKEYKGRYINMIYLIQFLKKELS